MANDIDQMTDQEIEAEIQALQETTDPTMGAPAGVRARASLFADPQQKYKFFQRTFQPENVRQGPTGEVEARGAIYNPKDPKTWGRIDEEGLSWGDLADLAGDIPELAGVFAGGARGSVLGAAAGAAGGNILRQFLASMYGEERPLTERATDVGVAAGAGATGQKIANVVGKALRGVSLPKLHQKEYTEEARAAAGEVGGKLTLSQETGSRPARIIEDQTRRNAMAADIMEQFEIHQQVKPAKAYLERVMGQLTPKKVPDFALGNKVAAGYERVVDTLMQQMQKNNTKNFSFLHEAFGRQPVIETNNLLQEMNTLATRYGKGTDFGHQITGLANKMKGSILQVFQTPEGKISARVTAEDLQDLLQTYGSRAFSNKGGPILSGLDTMADREVARKLYSALNKDLDAAVITGKQSSQAALLKKARDQHREDMGAIRELQGTVLGRHFGKNIPDESMERVGEWVRKLRPEEISYSMKILEIQNPGIREAAMRSILENSLKQAVHISKQIRVPGAMRPEFSMEELLKTIPEDDIINAVLGTKGEMTRKQLGSLMTFLERAILRNPGTLTLQQTPATALARGWEALSNLPLITALHRLTAKIMTSPQLREQIRTVARSSGRPLTVPAAHAARTVEMWLPAMIQGIQQELEDETARP